MKKIFTKNIFNKIKRKDIYFYIISVFFVLILLLFIAIIYQSKKIIKSIKQINYNNEIIREYLWAEENHDIFRWNKILSWSEYNLNSLFNFDDDKSITKFVNSNISFNDLAYNPDDLVILSWLYLVNSKWNLQLRKEALWNLQILAQDFYNEFSTKINVISAYRSYDYQVWIKNRWCSDKFCAKAWFSEHQTWLAVDLWEASSEKSFLSNKNYAKYFEWLKQNAYKYWFHNTYQKWLEIDTYVVEPWHWRYLWVDLASLLWENNLTIAEYYEMIK